MMNMLNQRYMKDTFIPTMLRKKGLRADSPQGVFAENFTTTILSEVFRKTYEQFKFLGGGLMPIDTSPDPGALAVGWDDFGYTSDAGDGIVADSATDIPSIDVNGERQSNPAHTVATSYTYSDTEMDTNMMRGNYNSVTDKADRAREDWERKMNNLIRFGSDAKNIPGFYRHPDITVEPAITGAWATATSAQIEADFSAPVTAMIQSTDGVEVPTTAVFSIPVWRRIEVLRSSTATDISVLEYLRRTHPFITQWTWDAGLTGQSDDGTDAVMIYKNTRQTIRAIVPKGITPKGPQERDLAWKVILWGRFAGLAVPRPRAVVRLEGV